MLSERPGNSPSTAVAVVDGLVLETTRRRLVDGARFSLRRVRAALVGRNGSGKTTLLEVLAAHRAGRPVPSHVSVRGAISWAPGTTCGHLPQHPSHLDEAGTVGEYLDSRAGEIGRLHRRLRALLDHEGALSRPGGLDEYGDVVERLTALDAWDLPDRRVRVLAGLDLGAEILDRPLRTLSGGETTRVALTGLLSAQPDLLLLDEPTNNLDAGGVAFLRDW